MTMERHEIVEVLDVLACDLEARPKSAPTIDVVSRHILGMTRHADTLVIAFDTTGKRDLEAFVAAESRCCASLQWDLVEGDPLTLRISGTPPQLESLAALFTLPGATA
jgi:hypothetical protein